MKPTFLEQLHEDDDLPLRQSWDEGDRLQCSKCRDYLRPGTETCPFCMAPVAGPARRAVQGGRGGLSLGLWEVLMFLSALSLVSWLSTMDALLPFLALAALAPWFIVGHHLGRRSRAGPGATEERQEGRRRNLTATLSFLPVLAVTVVALVLAVPEAHGVYAWGFLLVAVLGFVMLFVEAYEQRSH